MYEVQALMMIQNKTAYHLIESGQVLGNSVVDSPRCKTCNEDSCSYEGSMYIMNTLALEGNPNSPGTWVKPISAEDIGTIVTHTTKQTVIQKMIQVRLSSA